LPIYEYRCPDCAHEFEALQRMSDDPIGVCPNCASTAVARVLSAPAIHFKGSGFYNTDYGTKKRAAEKASSNGDGGSSKDSAGGTAGGTSDSTSTPASSGSSDSGSGSSKSVGLDKI
jgi:putative FmdB family regulatory protein